MNKKHTGTNSLPEHLVGLLLVDAAILEMLNEPDDVHHADVLVTRRTVVSVVTHEKSKTLLVLLFYYARCYLNTQWEILSSIKYLKVHDPKNILTRPTIRP